jgi:hypothetical protein
LLDRSAAKTYLWVMQSVPDYESIADLEPRIRDLERRARAVADDGEGSFFCSNFIWLPMYTEMRDLLGAQRKRVQGEAREGILFDSHAFEHVYIRLSKLLPACRNCGCQRFQKVMDAGGRG